ncbi:MAG: peptide deformylase [Actinomycetota bacterium]|nr:peptide deformylase [Actinomycetota bacterium]
MAVLPIRTFGDAVLKERCLEVERVDDDLKRLVRDMVDTLPVPGGAGLSANQIGVVKRVFIYENDDGVIETCINPQIISNSQDAEEELEGCLSLPGIGVPVPRYKSLQLRYLDMEGETQLVETEGWIARVFQHEIDHLDGKLILDRTDRGSRVEAIKALQSHQARYLPQDERHIL